MSSPRKVRGRPEEVSNAAARAIRGGKKTVLTGGSKPRKVTVEVSVEKLYSGTGGESSAERKEAKKAQKRAARSDAMSAAKAKKRAASKKRSKKARK
jgi:hypothetical protein